MVRWLSQSSGLLLAQLAAVVQERSVACVALVCNEAQNGGMMKECAQLSALHVSQLGWFAFLKRQRHRFKIK
jgi:hypothetical protein